MSEYQEPIQVTSAATPRWVGIALVTLAAVSLLGIGIGWSALNHANSVEQTTQTSVRQANDALAQKLAKEDEIFGLVAAARETQLPKDKLREQVRPLVKELLAKRKEEMQHRIDKLEMAKSTEMRHLNELNDLGETWIDSRIDEEMNRNGRIMPPGPRRMDRQPPKATSSASD